MTFDKPAFKGDDYDFALGSVKGLRSWEIDDKGRLRGVTHPAVWLPGENVATCRVKPRCPKSPPRDPWTITYGGSDLSGSRALIKPCGVDGCDGGEHPATHTFDPSCECGFWAYDECGYRPHGQVTGVVEGYGRTTIGSKGFRCEKARVLALARENEDSTLSLSKWLRLKELYPEAEFFGGIDDMVIAHGAVMKNWPAVGEDFWAEEREPVRESYTTQLSRLHSQIAAASASTAYYQARSSWLTGGVA